MIGDVILERGSVKGTVGAEPAHGVVPGWVPIEPAAALIEASLSALAQRRVDGTEADSVSVVVVLYDGPAHTRW